MHPIRPRFINQISHTNCGPPSEVRKVHDSPYNVRHTSPRSVICVYFSRSTIYTKYQYVCVCVYVSTCVYMCACAWVHVCRVPECMCAVCLSMCLYATICVQCVKCVCVVYVFFSSFFSLFFFLFSSGGGGGGGRMGGEGVHVYK